jgi:carbon monoxide dehydrogenase subunit G
MELTHTFTVPASVEDTWTAFTDLEMVAGCFPGAALTSVEGDDFQGTCKVKLGPISLTYAGSGTFLEKDDAAHRFVMEAKGKDKRGNGTAGATVTAALEDAGGGATRAEVTTDLTVTGKPAQFGRGVIQDVSDKLLQQFLDCLEAKLSGEPEAEPEPEPAHGAAEAAGAGSGAAEAGAGAAPAAGSATAPPGSAPGQGPSQPAAEGAHRAPESDEALDLGATVIPILLKSYWRQIAAGVLVLLVLRGLRRRRKRRRARRTAQVG